MSVWNRGPFAVETDPAVVAVEQWGAEMRLMTKQNLANPIKSRC